MWREWIRHEILQINPYTAETKAVGTRIFLDGNESPYALPTAIQTEIGDRLSRMELNRYPEISCSQLRQKIAAYLGNGITSEQILVGNGSDEVLRCLTQACLNPGDLVLTLHPTFSMYNFFTQLQGGRYAEFPLKKDGGLDVENFIETMVRLKPKMVFLCSPNNPTGTRIPFAAMEEIARRCNGVLVVDEAYGEFCQESMVTALARYENLFVTRTFSKALGVAGARLGYLVGNASWIRAISRGVLPYHLNSISQMIGEVILDHWGGLNERVQQIILEREHMCAALQNDPGWFVYPSESNFLFLHGKDIPALVNMLSSEGIRVRTFAPPWQDAIRVTIGKPEENAAVLQVVARLRAERVQSQRAGKG